MKVSTQDNGPIPLLPLHRLPAKLFSLNIHWNIAHSFLVSCQPLKQPHSLVVFAAPVLYLYFRYSLINIYSLNSSLQMVFYGYFFPIGRPLLLKTAINFDSNAKKKNHTNKLMNKIGQSRCSHMPLHLNRAHAHLKLGSRHSRYAFG